MAFILVAKTEYIPFQKHKGWFDSIIFLYIYGTSWTIRSQDHRK